MRKIILSFFIAFAVGAGSIIGVCAGVWTVARVSGIVKVKDDDRLAPWLEAELAKREDEIARADALIKDVK